MTGFGKSSFSFENKSVTMEIRSLNSKQLDLNTRIAASCRDKENEIRTIISRELDRGKIDLTINIDKIGNQTAFINEELAAAYFKNLTELSFKVGNKVESDIFLQVLRMPDVVSTTTETFSDEFWSEFLKSLQATCEAVNKFRTDEGEHLEKDFLYRIQLIQSMIEEITPFETNRIFTIRKKIEDAINNSKIQGKYDENRLEQELIFYLEKLDITEEKVRLHKHCSYFIDTLNESQSNGKKLGFILQEIGREVNTLGSKCNEFNIQQIVVRMKDEVEKMKEQVANIL